MRTAHFYDLSTGIFTGESFSFNGREDVLHTNIPTGCGAYEGVVDFLSQKLDIQSGRLIDYRPPRPSSDHEWHAQSKRWIKRADVVQRDVLRATALAKLNELEKRQPRIEREMRLRPNEVGVDGKTPFQRLEELDREITKLRSVITGEEGTT